MTAPQGQLRFRLQAFKDITLSTTAFFAVLGLIPREGVIVVWGPPKCGKTFIVTDLALHIALGWPYRGRRVVQGSTVYFACEGERGLAARIEAFRRARLAEDSTDVPFYLLPTRLDLAADRAVLINDIRAQLGDSGCSVVVIDTLNSSLGGGENNDQDMGNYIKAADAVREAFHCAVVVIHHCGTNDKRPRGHTSLTGAADAQIAVQRQDKIITATVAFMKDGEAGIAFQSTLQPVDLGEDENRDPIRSCVVEPVEEGAAPAQLARLTGQAKIALRLLTEALAREGTAAPAGNHFPAECTVVPLSLWRAYCEKGGLTEGDSDDAFKTAWKRVRRKLLGAGFIGIWGDWVWKVDVGGTG